MPFYCGFIAIILCCGLPVWADTTFVSGPISGVWDSTGNPYFVQDSVVITASNSLHIDVGCIIMFDSTARFVVQGTLRAEGSETDSIYFTCDTLLNPHRWTGLRFRGAEPGTELRYCVIENGRAFVEGDTRYAGGIEIQNCSPILEHCTIRRNSAAVDGGGIYIRDNSRPIIADCNISFNRANFGGGGLMIRGSRPTIVGCMITGNYAGHNGGGIVCRNGAVFSLSDCFISNNTTPDSGGGIYSLHPATAVSLEGCTISGNSAARGGGIYANSSSPFIYRTQFSRNFAISEGGAFLGDNFTSALINCILERNRAQVAGGAICLKNCQNVLVEFCTFISDSSAQGGDFYGTNSPALIRNNVFTDWRAGASIYNDSDSLQTVLTNCFWNGVGGPFIGTRRAGQGSVSTVNLNQDSCDSFGNIFFDPLCVNLANGDYHLTDDSPCISAGTTGVETSDIEGNVRPRPLRTQPDLGAYESERGGSGFLCGAVRDTIGPGDIVVGCNLVVENGDTLVIEAGTNLLFDGRYSITIRGTLFVNGTVTDSVRFTRRENNPLKNWRGLRFISTGRGRVAYAVLEYAEGTQFNPDSGCGAIMCDGTLPSFVHCSIRNNIATYRGGGISCYNNAVARFDTCDIVSNNCVGPLFSYGGGISSTGARPRFRQCRIAHNFATWGGGGAHIDSGIVSIDGCEFFGNSSRAGGAIYSLNSGLTVTNTRIDSNWCTETGGGIFARSFARFEHCVIQENFGAGIRGGGAFVGYFAPVFDHCIFNGNSAQHGGGLYIESSSPTLQNCTISQSTASLGDGMYLYNCAPTINSSIIANSSGTGLYFRGGSAASTIQYCDVFGNAGGNFSYLNGDSTLGPTELGQLLRTNVNGDSADSYRNISLNPQFVDANLGNYQILETSPCINAGDPLLAIDPDLSPADIGAYYFHIVYHPPAPFDLVSPSDLDTLRSNMQQFCWRASSDPDRGDSIDYSFTYVPEGGSEITIGAGADTCFVVDLSSLALPDSVLVRWYVSAHSFLPDTITNSSSFRNFYWYHTTAADENETALPTRFSLDEIYPNPFNGSATIKFTLPRSAVVELDLFDLTGRLSARLLGELLPGGEHAVTLSADDLPSGVYFVRMSAGDYIMSKKILLLK